MSCKLCNKWFTYTAPDKEALKDHYATIHKGEKIPEKENVDYEKMIKKVFKCIHCPKGKMFTHSSKHSMALHMKVNHRNIFIQDQVTKKDDYPDTFSCVMCKGDKTFYDPQKEKVIEHIKTMHKN